MENNIKNVATESSSPPVGAKTLLEELTPLGLEFLADVKTPLDILKIMCPTAKNFDGLAAIFSGVHTDLEIPIPLWATAAAKKFWKAVGLDLSASLETGNPADVGKWVGFIEQVQKSQSKGLETVNGDKLVAHFCGAAKSDAANASPEISKEFFNERANGNKILKNLEFLPQRAKTFLFIAVAWRKIEEFKSSGELHRFFLAEKIILPTTDAAETRKVCQIIGLKFESKAGRPPKKKNPVTIETP